MKYRFIITLVLYGMAASAQNLIENPSFEVFNKCPEAPSNMTEDVVHWSVPTEGTTDYFNQCSAHMGIPSNFNGSQKADFGKGYAGFYMVAPNDYREYLQAKLSETLTKGKRYGISFYISLAEKSKYAIRDIGLLFAKEKMKRASKKILTAHKAVDKDNAYNFIQITNAEYYADKSGWTRVYTEIMANGNENYLIIGNFKNNAGTTFLRTSGVKKAAYYYLDMVSVEPLDQKYAYNDLKLDKIYTLENVLFPSDEYVLGEKSKEGLDELYSELKNNPSLFITIHAHTDNEGSKDYNKILSAKRAKAVAQYLMALGLADTKIRWIGYGSEKPLAKNTTAEGKRKNRRAEFIISKNAFHDKTSFAETLFEDGND